MGELARFFERIDKAVKDGVAKENDYEALINTIINELDDQDSIQLAKHILTLKFSESDFFNALIEIGSTYKDEQEENLLLVYSNYNQFIINGRIPENLELKFKNEDKSRH